MGPTWLIRQPLLASGFFGLLAAVAGAVLDTLFRCVSPTPRPGCAASTELLGHVLALC